MAQGGPSPPAVPWGHKAPPLSPDAQGCSRSAPRTPPEEAAETQLRGGSGGMGTAETHAGLDARAEARRRNLGLSWASRKLQPLLDSFLFFLPTPGNTSLLLNAKFDSCAHLHPTNYRPPEISFLDIHAHREKLGDPSYQSPYHSEVPWVNILGCIRTDLLPVKTQDDSWGPPWLTALGPFSFHNAL